MLYYGLAVVAVIIVIFPWFYPCSGLVGSDGRSNCCINMLACGVFEQFRLL